MHDCHEQFISLTNLLHKASHNKCKKKEQSYASSPNDITSRYQYTGQTGQAKSSQAMYDWQPIEPKDIACATTAPTYNPLTGKVIRVIRLIKRKHVHDIWHCLPCSLYFVINFCGCGVYTACYLFNSFIALIGYAFRFV
eukprot:1142483_1